MKRRMLIPLILLVTIFLTLEFINIFGVVASVLTLAFVDLFLYHRKEINLEKDFEVESEKERFEEEKRKKEFPKKFPKISKIPILNRITKWMYKEGWYSVALVLLLVIGFMIQLYIAKIRWVGTDEGRLLYDSQLIDLGKVPFRDFFARAPLLIYILAILQKISPPSILLGRLVSILFNCGTTIIIFLIGKEFSNNKVALVSSFIYLFSPFIYLSTQVRTQPSQIFFVSLFIYSISTYFIKNKKNNHKLILSGIFLGLAITIRKSALIFLFTTFILFFLYLKGKKNAIKKYSLFFLSCFCIISICFIPFIILSRSIGPLLSGAGISNEPISLEMTFYRFLIGLNDILFFIPFLIIFFIILYKKFGASSPRIYNLKNSPIHIIPLSWFLSIFLFYFYYVIAKSFWASYFIEFIPPIAIISAGSVIKLFNSLSLNKKSYLICTLKRFTFTFLIVGLFIFSHLCAYSDPPRYTQETISEVSGYVKDNVSEDEYILCGSPIWAYMSQQRTVLDISHPRFDNNEIEAIKKCLEEGKIKLIILDGKMDKYFENLEIKEYIHLNYYTVKTVQNGDFREIIILKRKN
ncbi:MAG TPA: hypothetical protein ENI51_03115 [Candidatus Atribacteria bacterium]|nr:hypothetical protein [Candidatus Atribacteria bacterium]